MGGFPLGPAEPGALAPGASARSPPPGSLFHLPAPGRVGPAVSQPIVTSTVSLIEKLTGAEQPPDPKRSPPWTASVAPTRVALQGIVAGNVADPTKRATKEAPRAQEAGGQSGTFAGNPTQIAGTPVDPAREKETD